MVGYTVYSEEMVGYTVYSEEMVGYTVYTEENGMVYCILRGKW